MSQVQAAMKRHLPGAKELLAEIHQKHPSAGIMQPGLERQLTEFVAAVESGRNSLKAVSLWVKLEPILKKRFIHNSARSEPD